MNIVYAGFWRRFAAYLIDGVLLSAVQAVLATGVFMIAPYDLRTIANLAPVSAAMSWAYFALFESSPMRATVGKYTLGLYVSDTHGDPISFTRASARYWLKILSSLTLMVGWIMAAFTPRKQALHDLLAGTFVLKVGALAAPAPAEGIDEYWDGVRWLSKPSLHEEM